jgi:hypothetical protein
MNPTSDLAFDAFLTRKNINPEDFRAGDPVQFEKWRLLYEKVHEESFLLFQKFHINPIRRRFPLNRYS